MNLDYEAAEAELVAWSLEPEGITDTGEAVRAIVDAAVPKPCKHGFRRSHPVWHGEVEESWGWEPRSPDVWCEGKSEADNGVHWGNTSGKPEAE